MTAVQKETFYYHPLLPVINKPYNSPEVEIAEHGFDEVTKNIDVVKYLNDSRVTKDSVAKFVEVLREGDWKSLVFDDLDLFPLLALKAYKDGDISMGQFATVMLYHSVRKHYPKEEIVVYNLFEMKQAVIQTFHSHPEKTSSHLTNEKITHFYSLMKDLPKDQQQFFVITTLQPAFTDRESYDKETTNYTIKDAIQFRAKTNIFCDIEIAGKTSRMVPTFGMVQALLDAYSLGDPEGGVQLTPRIGLSTPEQIRENGLNRTRDVGIHFMDTPLPKFADEMPCPTEFDFFFHDAIYHAIVASRVDRANQKAFVVAYDILMKQHKRFSHPVDQEIVKTLAERFIDMEHVVYRTNATSKVDRFWNAMDTAVVHTHDRQAAKQRRLAPAALPEHVNILTKRIDRLLFTEGVLQAFVEEALLDPSFSQFNASFDGFASTPYILLPQPKTLYSLALRVFRTQKIYQITSADIQKGLELLQKNMLPEYKHYPRQP